MQGDRIPTPFDGRKVAYHLPHWSAMERGEIPPPVLVTLDPAAACNLVCRWCNSEEQTEKGVRYSAAAIVALPAMLRRWGVKAVCVAGGGEPLLHPRISTLLEGLHAEGLEIGVVTNGTLIDRHMDALGCCRWVGVSVDAGSSRTYEDLKRRDQYGAVTENMRQLRARWPALEITYKYLVHPDNIEDIPEAASAARSIGCNYFHARPAGRTWVDVQAGRVSSPFTVPQVTRASELLATLESCDDNGFIQATTSKFSDAWGISNRFDKCRAMGMTCVIQPDNTIGLCCDRRGDSRTTLGTWEHPDDIPKLWGNAAHWRAMSLVNLDDCPRCTYAPHNELYEAFVANDHTCKWFI
ncbi:MAG: radical SAM protein [bacterium]|nr:radical SAM protein [bacterium]